MTSSTLARTSEAATEQSGQGFGASVRRTEDYRLLLGTGTFTDDLQLPRTLHAAFVRSPHAHARIIAVNAERSLALPGVVAVFTGEDLAELTAPGVMVQTGAESMVMETLPTRKVRFNGDPVACVVAVDRYVAEDAVELVEVEYEPLDPILTMESAAAPGAPLVDEDLASNLHTQQTQTFGDVTSAFAGAYRIVEARFSTQRMTHVPIEPRGVLAVWDAGRRELTFHSGQQTAHLLRTNLARRLRLEENQVRVVSPDVGGAFGQKIPLFREELTVAALAIKLRRPIKWIEDRLENLTAANHARDDSAWVRAAVDKDGRILGMKAELWADYGAYAFFTPKYPIDSIGWLLPGPYKFRDYEYSINVVITNKCPAGTLRAPMALVTWATEGIIERIARELKLDPVEVRRRNMITAQDQPYVSATGYTYEALTMWEGYEQMLGEFDLTGFRARQRAARADDRYLGVGIASVLEPTTYGSAWYKKGGRGSGHEAATIKVEPSGAVNISVGIVPTGQGYETTIAQVVAEALGSRVENVNVRLGDTSLSPYGMGTRGSRGAAAGNAVAYLAAMEARGKLLRIAAHLIGEQVDNLEIRDDQIYVLGEPEPRLPLSQVSWTAYMDPFKLPPGEQPGLEIHRTYDPPPMTFSNATHLCVVEIERRTGRVTIQDYRVIEDAGTLINPAIVDGQIRGGVAMGIGQALLEEVVYDESGNNQTATFLDYLIPTMDAVPPIRISHVQTPNPHTVRGLKGMAEGPVQGGLAAVMLAVQDALDGQGLTIERSPASPSRIRALFRTVEGDVDE
ncbi:xanthine dehydrogenase family protein molybdopterin-binding subunit [Microbispora sp. H11081]|uniref:xanthine dehydrogenase family protein molybdopterin-binding subunit n=1 Tax=Microbispora sp. H11081 TaxID=2729107 RepID=UPI001474FF56|nr:xanthine dehydrogenase family protein molybdopterin-binding subunit [Microbispora sp. H11081]